MKNQAPHTHTGESVSGVMGKAVGALLPASIVRLVFFRFDALWITLALVAGENGGPGCARFGYFDF